MARKNLYQYQRVLYVVAVVLLSLIFISPFAIPIVLAGTIALTLYPFQMKLEKRNWKKNHAAGVLTALFTFIISIPFIFFITKGTLVVIDQLQRFALGEKLQGQGMQAVVTTLRKDIVANIQKYLNKLPIANFLTDEKLNQYLQSINTYLLEFFQNFASSIPSVVLFLLVMIFCTFSFLKNAASVREFFQNIFGFSNRKMDQLVGVFLRDSRQVYLSNVGTGAVQSLLVATSVYFVTKADWFLVFFVTLILSFVPVIGAAPMAFLFAVVAFFQSNTTGAIILLVVGVVAGVIDNLIRPWLASFGETKAPAIVSFIFVIGGALLLGFSGLFIGLLVGSIAYDTLPIFWEEIGKSEGGRNLSEIFSLKDKSKGTEEVSKH